MSPRRVCVGSIEFGNDKPFVLVGGVKRMDVAAAKGDVALELASTHIQRVSLSLSHLPGGDGPCAA